MLCFDDVTLILCKAFMMLHLSDVTLYDVTLIECYTLMKLHVSDVRLWCRYTYL